MAKRKTTKAKPKAKKERKVSFHRQPDDLSLRDYQVLLRKQFGKKQAFQIENRGDHPVWSDFSITNPESKSSYLISIRGTEPGTNYCECFDFKTNTLGTCKHLEWALFKLRNTWGNKQHFKQGPPPIPNSFLQVDYSSTDRNLQLIIGEQQSEEFRQLAQLYFTEEGSIRPQAWLKLDKFMLQARVLEPEFRTYPDALDLIIERREDERRHDKAKLLASQPKLFANLIKADLYPYQQEAALFAFRTGRVLLADEMGLGKTLQAIAAADLMKQEMGISCVIIVAPTSLKYQWLSEIEKFSHNKALVIEGAISKRVKQYEEDDSFYKILTYNVVARDYHYLNSIAPDLIILDEAQRIKNYDTKIAHAVKRLSAPNRMAITGTPLENKLEDIYSIVQFLDQHKLGPLWRLQARHEARDDQGIIRGYRHLDEINAKLADVMIRRRKKEVAKQLPPRIDKNLLVPMTAQQTALHNGYSNDLAQLVAKWRRHGFLSEKDRQRLMIFLMMMRMSCNSTFLVDQKTRHDTKIDELFYLLEERLADREEKVVIFSQWERMTRIVAKELEERGIEFANLHGGVPSKKRGALLERFREDDDCRIFLSTDAGGVGLNLQRAALVINLDLPWNPAVLEQRIARVHRLGQTRGVQVINLISEGTIEHRMVHTLRFKSSLAEAVLDTAVDSVFMSDRKFGSFMENLEKVQATPLANSAERAPSEGADLETPPGPGRTSSEEPATVPENEQQHQAVPDPANPTPVEQEAPDGQPSAPTSQEPDPHLVADPNQEPAPGWQQEGQAQTTPSSAPQAAGGAKNLVTEGASFLSRLANTLADEAATKALVSELTESDENGQTYLKIPVDSQATVANALKVLGGLFKL